VDALCCSGLLTRRANLCLWKRVGWDCCICKVAKILFSKIKSFYFNKLEKRVLHDICSYFQITFHSEMLFPNWSHSSKSISVSYIILYKIA
jgi:hypothetical protein